MKTLKEYIQSYKLPNTNNYTFEEFCDINSISNITEDLVSFYYQNYSHYPKFSISYNTWLQRLEENLKSHSSKQLKEKLYKEFKDDILDIQEISDKNSNNILIVKVKYLNRFVFHEQQENNILKNTKESHKLYDILQFFNYYITLIKLNDEENGWNIYIEPLYTENIVQEIKDNGGLIYHITHKDNLEKIKKTGIRPKVGKLEKDNGYRYFPERNYFIGNSKNIEDTINDIKNVIEDKQLQNDYIIFEIDVKNKNIELWKDNASNQKYSVYSYVSISPKLIRNIYEDYNKIYNK